MPPFWQAARVRPPDLRRTRRLLEPTGWLARARSFGSALRRAGHDPGRLLVVGTAEEEPWHLTAHLADAARFSGRPELAPVLVRHQVPPGAKPHLAVDLTALQEARAGSTVLFAAPGAADEALLERLSDVRRGGGVLFALHDGDDELAGLAHEQLGGPAVPVGFDAVTHLVTEAATEQEKQAERRRWGRRA